MKMLRTASGAVLGALIATVVCWGALYAFGALLGAGSLFDTNPKIADLFFAVWIGLAVMAFFVGAISSVVGDCSPRQGTNGLDRL